MRLYKYMPYRKKFFEDPLLRLTPTSDFNDPFDSVPSKEAILKKLAFLSCEDGEEYKEAKPELFDKMHTEKADVQGDLDGLGVLCLSEDYHNLLMWSHYADEHKGIVVGFDCDDDWLDYRPCKEILSDWSVNRYTPIPVKYRGRRPGVDLDDEFIYEYSNCNFVINSALTKSNDWIYEKEHRSLIQLSNANIIIIPKEKLEHLRNSSKVVNVTPLDKNGDMVKVTLNHDLNPYWSYVPKEAMCFVRPKKTSIHSVYFGCRFDIDEIRVAHELIKKSGYFDETRLFRAEVDESVFGLNFKELHGLYQTTYP